VRYRALACDYDGTLADAGAVAPHVRAALVRLRAAGVLLVLVTAPPELLERLRDLGVVPVVAGDVVVATLRPYETEAVAAVRALGLDLEAVYNKAALMLLPAGVDKGSGLDAALGALRVAPADTVGIGDGENDLPLLARCGLAVAVAGAVPALEAAADLVTPGGPGDGVAEIADALLAGDEAALTGVSA